MSDKETSSSGGAIEIQGLTKLYGAQHALNGIELIVKKGERFVIFGPNGAGKTTLIRVLAALTRPSAGSVHVDGIDIRRDPMQVRRRIGVVSHQTFLYSVLTVYENLKFYGKMYDVPDLEHKIREVVARVQLESRLHDRVGTLSRGLQQRASIARAVLHNPSIMFLDEPEVGLDPQAVIMMRQILGILNLGECTVVMTTHNLEQGIRLGDKALILNKGKIVYQTWTSDIEAVDFQEIYSQYTGVSK